MSSVTIGRDLQHGSGRSRNLKRVRSVAQRAAGSRRTSGEVVAGTDLRGPGDRGRGLRAQVLLVVDGRVFVLGVLAICALRGQYASRITLNVSKDVGTRGRSGRRAARGDRRSSTGSAGRCVPSCWSAWPRWPCSCSAGRAPTWASGGPDPWGTRPAGAHRRGRPGGGALRRRARAEPELRPAPDRPARRLHGRVAVPSGARRDRPARRRPAGSPHRPGRDRLRREPGPRPRAGHPFLRERGRGHVHRPPLLRARPPGRAARRRHGVGLPTRAAAPLDHALLGSPGQAGLRLGRGGD